MRAFRMTLISAALLIGGGAPALAQSETDAMPPAVEQCIRDNAPAVEQAFTNLNDGVNFLVSDLCGAPIAADQERKNREKTAAAAAQAHAQCEANRPADRDPKQSDLCDKPAPNFMSAILGNNPLISRAEEVAAAQVRYYGSKPPVPTSFAAKLLLELRLKRLNAAQQGTH